MHSKSLMSPSLGSAAKPAGSSTTRPLIYLFAGVAFVLIVTAPDANSIQRMSVNVVHWWGGGGGGGPVDVVGVTIMVEQPLPSDSSSLMRMDEASQLDEAWACMSRVAAAFARPSPHNLLLNNASLTNYIGWIDRTYRALAKQTRRDQPPRQSDSKALDSFHERLVVKPWMQAERLFARDARYIRLFGACLRGGGHGTSKPLSAAFWAARGGVVAEHPFFAALHGGVSPRRVINQALRVAEYLGVPTELYGRVDEDAMSRMPLPPAVTAPGQVLDDLDVTATPRVVVDLGCGHGAMLAAMCPPHPSLWCFGVDFTGDLIQRRSRAFRHMDLRSGIAAPHLPAGYADAVLSHGVIGVIHFAQTCAHMEEMLRLLKPGTGVATLWQAGTTRWARYHPAFFAADDDFYVDDPIVGRAFEDAVPAWAPMEVDPAIDPAVPPQGGDARAAAAAAAAAGPRAKRGERGGRGRGGGEGRQPNVRRVLASRVLSRCPNGLGRYVRRVDIIAGDAGLPIYTPMWDRVTKPLMHWPGSFGIRIFRNGIHYTAAPTAHHGTWRGVSGPGGRLDVPPSLKRLHADPSEWAKYVRSFRRDLDAATRCESFDRDAKTRGAKTKASSRGGRWCLSQQRELDE